MSIVGDWVIDALVRWRSNFSYSDKFADGKLNLRLHICHNADATVIEQWKQSFFQASKLLFHATNGQLQFGTIDVVNNTCSLKDADALLFECSGRSSSGSVMRLCGDERFHPYIIIHELGHYAFNLGDEYRTISNDVAFCSGDPSEQRCIMEHKAEFGDSIDPCTGLLTLGLVNEYCDETNHDETSGNVQETRIGHSCWQTIINTPPFTEFVVPSPQRPYSEAGHVAVVWEELLPIDRFLFVLDLTLVSSPRLAGIVDALSTWAEYCRKTKNAMGLVGSNGQILIDLQPVDTDESLRQIRAELAKLKPQAAQLRTTATLAPLIFSKLQPSANQTFVWITEKGLDRDSLIDLARQLRQLKVRAYPIDITNLSQELSSFARETGGVASYIRSDIDSKGANFELQTAILSLSADLIENAGILGYEEISWPPTANPAAKAKLKDNDVLSLIPVGELPSDAGRDFPFYVEEDCERLNFFLSCKTNASVKLVLISPDGSVNFRGPNESHKGTTNLQSISNPSRGVWTARVLRNSPEESKVTLIAVAENKRLQVDLDFALSADSLAIGLIGHAEFDAPINNLSPIVDINSSCPNNESRPIIAKLYPASLLASESIISAERAVGTYIGEVTVGNSGIFTLNANFRSNGAAIRSGKCKCTGHLLENLVPPFERIVRRQVVVK